MTTNNNKKSKDNLLEAIDQMIDVESGISSCSFEISHKLREVRKLIIVDRERMVKQLTKSSVFVIAEEDGGNNVPLERAIVIVTGKEEKGDSDKQE